MKLQQWHAQETMRERMLAGHIPDSLTTRFTDIDKDAAVQWEEAGRECYVNGKLYDVIATETINGHTVFTCICDEQEEQAIRALGSLNGQDPSAPVPGKKLALKLIKELFSVFVLPAESFRLCCFAGTKTVIVGPSYGVPQDYLHEVAIPPPDAAVSS